MVFDGEELLRSAIKSIREQVDFVAVTWQKMSYHGNPNETDLEPLLNGLKNEKLLDQAIFFEPNLNESPKENELKLRNIGLKASKDAGCTHHISFDVDEFILPDQLKFAKETYGDHDCSMIENIYYYKKPTWRMHPNIKNNFVSFIHKIDTKYEMIPKYPYRIEFTRRLTPFEKIRVYTQNECAMHHMTYVRKDMAKKLRNSMTGKLYDIDKFVDEFNRYEVGNRLVVAPDFLTRRTVVVDNIFNIDEELWHNQ
jgi:hypothetical protein